MNIGTIRGFQVTKINGLFHAKMGNKAYQAESISDLDQFINGKITRPQAKMLHKKSILHDLKSVQYFLRRK